MLSQAFSNRGTGREESVRIVVGEDIRGSALALIVAMTVGLYPTISSGAEAPPGEQITDAALRHAKV